MERMHPEDLRAIIAAHILGGLMSDPQCSDPSMGGVVDMADSLLKKLTSTAKPGPGPLGHCSEECVDERDWALRRIRDLENKLALPHGCHRAHPHEDDPDCPGNRAFRHGKEEGTRQERERCVRAIAEKSLSCGDGSIATEEDIREILDPGPPAPGMVPNPLKGLQVELPQMPGLDLEMGMGPHRRVVASMHQDYIKASEAAILRGVLAEGARCERERIIKLIDESPAFYLADKFGVYAEAKIREALEPKP